MEDDLHKRVIGQQEAISADTHVPSDVRGPAWILEASHRLVQLPGPTGVGKTELAKALAEFMFGSEDALIKVDMSEFKERHTVSRLCRAPPGYVGFEEGGQLTDAVRRKKTPHAVLLLDEIEKAHPEVSDILLQIMEDGRCRAPRAAADFLNTIVILTSNLGARQLQTKLVARLPADRRHRGRPRRGLVRAHEGEGPGGAQDLLPARVPQPDRCDDRLRSLTQDEIREIVDLMLARVRDQLRAQQMSLEVTRRRRTTSSRSGTTSPTAPGPSGASSRT